MVTTLCFYSWICRKILVPSTQISNLFFSSHIQIYNMTMQGEIFIDTNTNECERISTWLILNIGKGFACSSSRSVREFRGSENPIKSNYSLLGPHVLLYIQYNATSELLVGGWVWVFFDLLRPCRSSTGCLSVYLHFILFLVCSFLDTLHDCICDAVNFIKFPSSPFVVKMLAKYPYKFNSL